MSEHRSSLPWVVRSIVPLEFEGLRHLDDVEILLDSADFSNELLSRADARVLVPLLWVVRGLDLAARARFGQSFTSLPEAQRADLWYKLRDLPGFAQLKQVIRTSALMRISEWEGFVCDR